MAVHALYEAFLDDGCRRLGLDPLVVRGWIDGTRAIPEPLAMLFEHELGVPRSSFKTQPYKPLVPPPKPKAHQVNPAAISKADAGKLGGLAKARAAGHGNRVSAKLDKLGWSVKDLAQHVGAHLKRNISKTSMHFWAAGMRKQGKKGAYYTTEVHAPEDVKAAAEKVTGGILLSGDWP